MADAGRNLKIRDDIITITTEGDDASQGGCVQPKAVWCLATSVVENARYVCIDTMDVRARKFLGDDFGMLKALLEARNRRVAHLMSEVEAADDPMMQQGEAADDGAAVPRLKRKRRELLDEILMAQAPLPPAPSLNPGNL